MKLSLEEAHDYWKNPPLRNSPAQYIYGTKRSKALYSLIDRYISKDDKILELGCNVGRNLKVLQKHGFNRLWGIEINENAVKDSICPQASFMISSIEEIIKEIPDKHFDVIFTMAVLMHIPYESEWIMEHIARITKKHIIITEIEKESPLARFYTRNYILFEKFGFKQIMEEREIIIERYITRVFKREY